MRRGNPRLAVSLELEWLEKICGWRKLPTNPLIVSQQPDDQMAPPRATQACGASWHAARPARTWGPSVIVTAQGTKATLATATTDGPAPVTGKYHRTRLFVLTLGYSRKSMRLLTFDFSARRWVEPTKKRR